MLKGLRQGDTMEDAKRIARKCLDGCNCKQKELIRIDVDNLNEALREDARRNGGDQGRIDDEIVVIDHRDLQALIDGEL